MARVAKVAAGVAARKGKAEKKIRTTAWINVHNDYLNWSKKVYFFNKKYFFILFINLI
jgi:hypothetical protein